MKQTGNGDDGQWPARFATGLAVISLACGLASLGLYAYNLSHGISRVQYSYGDNLVAGVIFPLTGAFLIRRRGDSRIGWVLVAAGFAGVNALAGQYAVAGLRVPHATLPGAEAAAWVNTWGWAPELVVLPLLPLLFPDDRLPSPRWRPVAWAILACAGLLWPRPWSRPSVRTPTAAIAFTTR